MYGARVNWNYRVVFRENTLEAKESIVSTVTFLDHDVCIGSCVLSYSVLN